MDLKPGWKTSEFWLAAISTVVAALVAFGGLPPRDAADSLAPTSPLPPAGAMLDSFPVLGAIPAAFDRLHELTRFDAPDWRL